MRHHRPLAMNLYGESECVVAVQLEADPRIAVAPVEGLALLVLDLEPLLLACSEEDVALLVALVTVCKDLLSGAQPLLQPVTQPRRQGDRVAGGGAARLAARPRRAHGRHTDGQLVA